MRKGLLLLMLLLALCAGGCPNITKGKAAAQSQLAVFHQHFNDQNLEAIMASAHPDFLKTSTKAEVVEFLGAVRRKLGSVTHSETRKWNVRTINGVTSVVLVQKTTFESGEGTETFTFRIKKEKASLLGYKILSKDLIVK